MEKSYVKGIIGGLIGGLIATIPWIVAYVYGNMILSLLAIIVAMGVLKGYQLLNGKVDKKLSLIVVIISLICITIATLFIIPGLLVVQNDASFTIENIIYLYSNSDFVSAIMRDYAVSVLFTFLGISGVVTSIRNQINYSDSKDDIKFNFNNGNNMKDKDKLREYFVSKNAIDENNMIEITNESGININTLVLLTNQGIVIKKDNKYYFSLEQEAKNKRNSKIAIIVIVSILVIMFGLGIYLSSKNNDSNLNNSDNENNEVQPAQKNINVSIKDSYREYVDSDNENSWFYMPKLDLSGESGFLNVYYFEGVATYSEDWALQVKTNLENSGGKVLKYEHLKNNHNLDVLKYDYQYENYIDYIYYIFGNNGYIGVVEVVDYDNNETLQKDGLEIVKDYKWLS